MATSVNALFTHEVVAKVNKLIDTGLRTGEIVSAWEEIRQVLLEASLAWEQQVPPEYVGVHPLDRSGTLVGGSESHHHGAGILAIGFSWKKASDVTAIQSPPSPQDQEFIAVNKMLVSINSGLIPPLVALRLLSIGGGHTNTFLRAVKAGCRSAVPKLADESGCLSADKLCAGRQSFRDAVEHGLRWFVLHHDCAAVWPNLIHFVQSVLNTDTREYQSEVEIMLAMHMQQQAAFTAGREPDWSEIQKSVCFSMPPCAKWIALLANYVRLNAGGLSGELLLELRDFSRAFGCSGEGSSRTLGSEFFMKLNSLNFGQAQRFPYLINAAIKANLTSPKVVDGVCKLVLPSHLSALTSKNNRSKIEEAECLMKDARKLVKTLHFPDGVPVTCIGQLDVRCVLHILNKSKDAGDIVFDSINAIAEASSVISYPCLLFSLFDVCDCYSLFGVGQPP